MAARAEAQRSGHKARLQARNNEINESNTGLSTASYCNLIVLPQRFAADFKLLCLRNPVPLPLLEQIEPGSYTSAMAAGSDIRTDIPHYNVYRDGHLLERRKTDVTSEWSSEHVGFLMGCSLSLETALTKAGLTARNTREHKTPPVLKTSVRLLPSGSFEECYMLVSMRWYRPEDLAKVRQVTQPLPRQHGEPVEWDWDGADRLGLREKLEARESDYGEWSEPEAGEIPVFWGCGVTAEAAISSARIPGITICHFPG